MLEGPVQAAANARDAKPVEGVPVQRWSYGNRRAPSLRGLEPLPPNADHHELQAAVKLAQTDAVRAIDLLHEVEAERDWLLARLQASETRVTTLTDEVEDLAAQLHEALALPPTQDAGTQTKRRNPYNRDTRRDFAPVPPSAYVDVREGIALTEQEAMALREADPTRPVARVDKTGTTEEQKYFNEIFKMRRALATQGGDRHVRHQRYEHYKGYGYSGRGARTSWSHNPSKPVPNDGYEYEH